MRQKPDGHNRFCKFTYIHLKFLNYILTTISYITNWLIQPEVPELYTNKGMAHAQSSNITWSDISVTQPKKKSTLQACLTKINVLNVYSMIELRWFGLLEVFHKIFGENPVSPVLLICPSSPFSIKTLVVCINKSSRATGKSSKVVIRIMKIIFRIVIGSGDVFDTRSSHSLSFLWPYPFPSGRLKFT